MVKKKGKKGNKGKKAKADKKDALSNLDKEKYLLTIAELEHKIEWRRHQCNIIEENKKSYEEGFESQKRDKTQAVNILQEAIDEEKEVTEDIERAVVAAEKRKRDIQENHAMRLLLKLQKMQEETTVELGDVENMQKEFECLENYDSEKEGQRLKRIERELRKDPFLEGLDKRKVHDRRRLNAFNKIIADLVDEEMEKFGAELEASADNELRELEAENRWLAEQVNFLKQTLKRQRSINKEEAYTLTELKKSVEKEKIASEKAFSDFRENEAAALELKTKLKELQKKDTDSAGHSPTLSDKEEEDAALEALKAEEGFIIRSLTQIRENEEDIQRLEDTLLKETAFGEDLQSFIERAWALIEKEAKTPLILTYNGPPETKNTVEALRNVFDEATKFIYERGNRTML